MTEYRDRFQRVFDGLSRVELQQGDLDAWVGADVLGRDDERWLGFYTPEGIRTALDRYGLFADLAQLGFEKADIEVRSSQDEHILRIVSLKPSVKEPLLELVVKRTTLIPTDDLAERFEGDCLSLLQIEWLLLQNPAVSFDAIRPPLPGQRHPGLGIGKQVMEILRNAARRLNLDGLITVPSYFHNAFFYSEEFFYFDPRLQGAFFAACRDVLPSAQSNVGAASWAFVWKLVRDARGANFEWFHASQVCPLSPRLVAYFNHPGYDKEVAEGLTDNELTLDRHELAERLSASGIFPFDAARIEALLTP